MTNKHRYWLGGLAVRATADYFKASGKWGLIEQIVSVSQAISWAGVIFITQRLFDALVLAQPTNVILMLLVSVACMRIVQHMLSRAEAYFLIKTSYGNVGYFLAMFQLKLSSIDASYFEDEAFLNEVEKVKTCVKHQKLGHFTYSILQILSYYLIYLIAISVYLFLLYPTLLFILLTAFVPALLGQLLQAKLFTDLEDRSAPLRRKQEHYHEAITGRDFVAETRGLGAFSYFYELYVQTMTLIVDDTWRTEKKAACLRLLLSLLSFVGLATAIWLLFNVTMAGHISVGAFGAVFIALSHIFSTVGEVVEESLGSSSQIAGQVGSFYRLMDMDEVAGACATFNLTEGVVAEDISFSYTEDSTPAVNGVSLTIAPKERVAIVGENGSGKTTLVRLLAGIYKPNQGKVTVFGMNTATVHPRNIYSHITAVFQHFGRYKLTLLDNVSISNLTEVNETVAEGCLKVADFDGSIGLEAYLSAEFNGIEISGGQWQRVAIARGLYRPYEMIILDEPTAAIDPIEEERLHDQFARVSVNKCAVIVTHRLASARLADKIVVMDHGKIVEQGTHTELIAKGGKYLRMWNVQAERLN